MKIALFNQKNIGGSSRRKNGIGVAQFAILLSLIGTFLGGAPSHLFATDGLGSNRYSIRKKAPSSLLQPLSENRRANANPLRNNRSELSFSASAMTQAKIERPATQRLSSARIMIDGLKLADGVGFADGVKLAAAPAPRKRSVSSIILPPSAWNALSAQSLKIASQLLAKLEQAQQKFVQYREKLVLPNFVASARLTVFRVPLLKKSCGEFHIFSIALKDRDIPSDLGHRSEGMAILWNKLSAKVGPTFFPLTCLTGKHEWLQAFASNMPATIEQWLKPREWDVINGQLIDLTRKVIQLGSQLAHWGVPRRKWSR